MNDNVNVVVTPLVRVALHGENDLEVPFNDLLENAHEDHDPATISDINLIALVETHMDIAGGELVQRVYGEVNPRGGYDDEEVGLVVSRPATGNIMIRPQTKLGLKPPWAWYNWKGQKYWWEYQSTNASKSVFYAWIAIALSVISIGLVILSRIAR